MLDALETWVPRSLRTGASTLARDARAVAGRLAGRRPPPFHHRAASTRPSATLAFRRLAVIEVVRETDDAVSLVLEDESGAPIDHAPGQFLTLLVDRPDGGGEGSRRAYSIAWSSEDRRRVAIGVKRVTGGRVSTHLVERARPGDRFQALGPSGSFVPREEDGRSIVLIGGGSGITPLLRIAAERLARRPEARVALVLANRRPRDVMFRDHLATLAAEHAGRFTLVHVHDEPEHPSALRGPLERAVLRGVLAALPFPLDARATFFVCGPAGMMDEARAALASMGIAEGRVREERFATTERSTATAAAQRVTFRLRDGAVREVVARPGATLLEAGTEAGIPMPYSCAVGGCGACRVRASGDVAMPEPSCLADHERAAGDVLACVATARGPVVVELP